MGIITGSKPDPVDPIWNRFRFLPVLLKNRGFKKPVNSYPVPHFIKKNLVRT
ncbi:hypothetical protein HanIR_Chr09g0420061 [Helianthus annuus]|nr:hypothetical protein HanIR_Chr09g0420061 [Helianthus annuus]